MASVAKRVQERWEDVAKLVLGVWLVISPWVLAFAAPVATWNAVVLGLVIALIALAALVYFHIAEEWVSVALAVWLVISPWVLGFAGIPAALWNHVIVGLLVAALALWPALRGTRGSRVEA